MQAEDGTITKHFDKPIPGWRDYIHIDDKLHLTVGNRNAVVIVRKSERPPIVDRLPF